MKKLSIIAGFIAAIAIVGCTGSVKRSPNSVYMPDMAYSRAYETYADHSNLKELGINYNNRPVVGTIARGEEFPFPLAMDAAGDTTNYTASKAIPNPIDSLSVAEATEAERLYLINCGICHGKNLDGNGPLWKDGNGPFPAAPANLIGNAKYTSMPAGQMFYSVMYGKNTMGSYASQLNRKQRWQVIAFIKAKQKAKTATTAPTAKDAVAKK
jgi:mono/diheme cytochrome c family protein